MRKLFEGEEFVPHESQDMAKELINLNNHQNNGLVTLLQEALPEDQRGRFAQFWRALSRKTFFEEFTIKEITGM